MPDVAVPADESLLRFGAFFAPFSPIWGNLTLQLRRGLDLAVHLDEIGFDEAWFGEHHSSGMEIIPAPDIYIAAAAERTRRIRFGTGVVSLPYHHPLLTCDRICQLDHQTMGRVIFGTGPGKLALDAHMLGIDPNRQRAMQAEALDVVMPLLRGEVLTVKTDWFELRDARLQILPFDPAGLEVVAASTVSPSGSVIAGKHGLSLLSLAAGSPAGFDTLDTNWEIYERESLRHGHFADRRRWRCVAPIFLAETVDEARAAVRRRAPEIARYIEKNYGRRFEWAETADGVIDRWVSEDGMPGFGRAVIGTPEQAIESIQRLIDKTGGFGTFLIYGVDLAGWEETKRSFELFAMEVIPHFRKTNRGRVASDRYMAENASWLGERLAGAVNRATEQYFGAQHTATS